VRAWAGAALLAVVLWLPARAAEDPAAVDRGRYLFHAGACDSCHTDHPNHGAFLAGGRRMATELGTFLVPNITPDPTTGIGTWSAADFRRAMVEGRRPDGSHYYPVFPYRWYTGMTAQDVADLWAYLRSVPPVARQVGPHELPFPLNLRALLLGWKLVNFDQGSTVADPSRSDAWNRGAYLVNHLGHCGACHTPKLLGAVFLSFRFLAGSEAIPGPYPAPNITPDPTTGLGGWSEADMVRALGRRADPRADGRVRRQRLEPSERRRSGRDRDLPEVDRAGPGPGERPRGTARPPPVGRGQRGRRAGRWRRPREGFATAFDRAAGCGAIATRGRSGGV
jgi:mono/diheme cytochrome c family protein